MFRPSRVFKPSWLAVILFESPFPLAVGFSERLRWKTKSNPAASASGLCAVHGSRQLLVLWIVDLWLSVLLWDFQYASMVFSSTPKDPLPGPSSFDLFNLRFPGGETKRRRSLESSRAVDSSHRSGNTHYGLCLRLTLPVRSGWSPWCRPLRCELILRKARWADTGDSRTSANAGKESVRSISEQ
jgi:hypothetical protein